MKTLFSWLGLGAAVAIMLFGIFVGVWHLFHLVVAPQFGLLSTEQIWNRNVEVATSPFRLLEEKEAALDKLLAMSEFAETLTPVTKQQIAQDMYNIIFMEEYPLDLKYKGARVRSMLTGEQSPKTVDRSPQTATSVSSNAPDESLEADLEVLGAMLEYDREALRRNSSRRTRVFVTRLRQTPCHPQLVQLLEQFSQRDDLPPLERSFAFGLLNQVAEKCS